MEKNAEAEHRFDGGAVLAGHAAMGQGCGVVGLEDSAAPYKREWFDEE